MIQIEQIACLDDIAAARELLGEYQESLGIDLGFQGFESELANLPGEYAPPMGRFLLARSDVSIAGCVALRPFGDDLCEMKRLYVRPLFRASGVGSLLVERVIAEARSIQYKRMYLDTLPSMARAQRLYERLGFRDTPAYRHNPVAGTRFLALDL